MSSSSTTIQSSYEAVANHSHQNPLPGGNRSDDESMKSDEGNRGRKRQEEPNDDQIIHEKIEVVTRKDDELREERTNEVGSENAKENERNDAKEKERNDAKENERNDAKENERNDAKENEGNDAKGKESGSQIEQVSVAIIGAGISALSAALHLHSNGFTNVVILEASSRAGGRIHTYIIGGKY